MKSKQYFIMMVTLIIMAACNSSSDEPTQHPVQDIAGAYEGYTVAEFVYTTIPVTTAGEKLSLTANEDGTANISFESGTWGKFTITGAEVSFQNGTYSVKGSGTTLMGMESATQSEYDCTVEGTISKDKKTVSYLFKVPSVMGGLKITFTQGEAPVSMLIAKVYEGELGLSVGGANYESAEGIKTVTIRSQDDGKAEVTLGAFGLEGGGMNIDDIVVADVEISEEDGYKLTGTIDTTNGSMNITGNMEGTIKDGIANIVFHFKPGAMPLYITATFTGK